MKDNDAMEACLTEMFKRVGLDYSMKEIIEYAEQKDWYWLKTWTEAEQDAFSKWMYKFLGDNTTNKAYLRRQMVDYYMLQYGWRIG